MSKNLLISLVVIVLFAVGVYYFTKNMPEKTNMQSAQMENINENQVMENEQVPAEVNTTPSTGAPEMQVLRAGEGEAMSKAGDTLGVLYQGYFQDGTIFDSNVESGQNFEFTLGAGEVIQGWEIGLVGMKVGEVRRIAIPPAYAYGENAVGTIPANSTLVFDVELKEIK